MRGALVCSQRREQSWSFCFHNIGDMVATCIVIVGFFFDYTQNYTLLNMANF